MLGARFVAFLQHTFPPHVGDWMLSVSSIGDPSKGFIVFFPIILSLNYLKGVKFLGAFIICEWFNMVSKWVLHGERPYWWVIEKETHINLQQTYLTCETGPGVPSGHSQAASVIWFCLADSLVGCMSHGRGIVWMLYVFMQISMFFSRVYIAAHFPHQCLLGYVVGLIIVKKILCQVILDSNESLLIGLHFNVSNQLSSRSIHAASQVWFRSQLVYKFSEEELRKSSVDLY